MRYHLGLDVGATHTRCLVVDADHQPVARHTQATPQRTTATGLVRDPRSASAATTTTAASQRGVGLANAAMAKPNWNSSFERASSRWANVPPGV